ncbi:hypothetical protein PUN28_007314 [Cardiocondyla obscurior]|uniref:Uncharacterized protein n=1 Tax=Cardiocondyla obscurior TaxID=286306 RepID=A0AAW2G8I7_9HYME
MKKGKKKKEKENFKKEINVIIVDLFDLNNTALLLVARINCDSSLKRSARDERMLRRTARYFLIRAKTILQLIAI